MKNLNDLLKEIDQLNKYNIEQLSDGYEIIEKFLDEKIRKRIKVIIIDENLIHCNGSEAIKFIRKYEERNNILKGIPLVSLTADQGSSKLDYLRKCGANLIYIKPLSKSAFKKIIEMINEQK